MEALNTYEVTMMGGRAMTVQGKSRSAAKYAAFLEDDSSLHFGEFLRYVEAVHLLHRFRPSDLFGDPERFERMKEARGIPFAYIGEPVILHSPSRGDLRGIICGSNSSMNLDILFDGCTHAENCHPHYRLTYLDSKGKSIANFE